MEVREPESPEPAAPPPSGLRRAPAPPPATVAATELDFEFVLPAPPRPEEPPLRTPRDAAEAVVIANQAAQRRAARARGVLAGGAPAPTMSAVMTAPRPKAAGLAAAAALAAERAAPEPDEGAGAPHYLIASVLGEPHALSRVRPTRIGRDADNDVILSLPQVSRKHAVVRFDARGDAFVLSDLGSANGTFVNGRSVRRRRLEDGDRIVVGPFSLVYRTRTGASESPPPAKSLDDTDAVSSDSLSGDLAEVPVKDVVRFISALKKTGELAVNVPGGGGRGTLYFRGGRPVHAEWRDQMGEPAAIAILKARKGVFRFATKAIEARESVAKSLDALLAAVEGG